MRHGRVYENSSSYFRYTLEEFEDEYNGHEEWELAVRDPDIESDNSNYYSTTEEEFGVEVCT